MSTFVAVNDELLICEIGKATKRLVYIAPGISKAVAFKLSDAIKQIDRLDVTVILDTSDEVCRIGYGDIEGLELLHKSANHSHFALRKQQGIRTGILIVDDNVLVWTPTPLSIEDHPHSNEMPNGVMLGENPGKQIALAVSAEGTDANVADAEVATVAITKNDVDETAEELKRNPPVPVDLARATRVFSAKFQFIEIEMKHVNLSKRQMRIPSAFLNADADKDLRYLLDTKLKALEDLRYVDIEVSEFSSDGSPAFDSQGKQKKCLVNEASLERKRKMYEKTFLFNLPGYGRIIERELANNFLNLIKSYEKQLKDYAAGIEKHIEAESDKLVDQVINLVQKRNKQSAIRSEINIEGLRKDLRESIDRVKEDKPSVRCVLKDVTYQQTQDKEFQRLLELNVPSQVMKRVGWDKWANVRNAVLVRTNNFLS